MHKIAVQTAPWFDFENPLMSLQNLKKHGFEAVDFNIDILAPSKEYVKRDSGWTSVLDARGEDLFARFKPMKDALKKTGISVCQMHAPFPIWHENKPEVSEYVQFTIEQCIRVAGYLSCPAIVVHGIKIWDKAREWELNLPIYRRLGKVARECGVTICLENLFIRFHARTFEGNCAEAEEAVRYIDTLNAEFGAEVFGFCFDVGHANMLGKNMRHYLRTLGSRLKILHIHDNDGKDDLHLVPYTMALGGGQTTDWDAFLEGLRDIHYQGELSFETFRALTTIPPALWDATLSQVAAVGNYFKQRIEE